jgi:porphobilinogen synthase
MSFPITRLRRLRRTETLRGMVRETRLAREDLVQALFVVEGTGRREPVASMPGVNRYSVDQVVLEAKRIADLGIPAVILFGVPAEKDARGSGADRADGIVQRATRAIADAVPSLCVITDVCLCEYTSHGHCGLLTGPAGHQEVDNDPSLERLASTAVSHARAGASIVAPSDMMDGRVAAIRRALDANGFEQVSILAYSAKYASAFYGPFRDAVGAGTRLVGDKKTYQMNPGNSDEALRLVARDLAEGADMVMVKPGMPYLDICRRVKDAFGVPTFAYQVSGEYAMIRAAAANGWIDGEKAMVESLLAFRRAGCDGILTYFAPAVARLLGNSV